ncbi:MAG: ATP-binding protein [Planctomycetota bacterium]|jgi:DNA replication protein DnaC
MVKEISSYKFADVPKLNKKYVLDLARCKFIKTRTNQVLTGSCGVGKTQLAIAFGREPHPSGISAVCWQSRFTKITW